MGLPFEIAGAVSLFIAFIGWLIFNELLDALGVKAQNLMWSLLIVLLSVGLGMLGFYAMTGASALDWILTKP